MKKIINPNLEKESDFKELTQFKESEERFRKTFEKAAVGIAHVGANGNFILINQKFCDIVGYSQQEMLKLTFQDITHPDDLGPDLNNVQQLLDQDIETYSMEKRYFRKDKSIVWVNLSVSLVQKETGEPLYFIAVVEDISMRKQVEDRFQLLVDQAGDAFFILDSDGALFDVNQQACHSTGYSRKELLKMNITEVDMEVEKKQHKQQFWNSLEQGQYITFEGIHRRKNGSLFPVEVRLGRLDLKGKILYLALSRDILKRKQEEEELKKHLEFQKLIITSSTLFINLPEDKIDLTINDQFEEIGKFFKADRITIAQLNLKGEITGVPYMWFSTRINEEKFAGLMKGAKYPNYVNHLKNKDYWTFSDPSDFSDWHPEIDLIEKTNFKSSISIKLSFIDSKLEVFVIDFKYSYVWTQSIIEQVKLLANIFSMALKRKQAEQILKKNAEFEHLVSRISMKFIGLSDLDFEQTIHKALEEIGNYFGVDTVRLYKLSLKGDVIKIRNMWRNEQLAPQKEMSEIQQLKYPNLASHYSKGKSVVFSNYNESPPWPEIRKILKFFGTKAGVGVPLEVDNSGVDIFAMDKVQSDHIWSNDIVEKSQAIGMVMLSALRRREAEIKLQDSFDEINRLKERLEQENIYFQKEIKVQKSFDTIIGQSTSLKYVLYRLEQVAPTNATVLIEGETGTGKELFANALHMASALKNKPLIKVGCAALSPTLIESELFGHEKGAFTGANEKRIGRFELADGGTIFLDEIGELSLELQAKLLRVLQEGEFERIGSSKTMKVDVRVITATNRNLEEEIKQGRFRQDLYYRLNVFVITIPPLRERSDDIPLLVKFLVDKFKNKHNKKIKNIPRSIMRNLENYSWPGNVRELENVLENAVIISDKGILTVETPGTSGVPLKFNMKLEDMEKDHIIQVLESANWRIDGKGGAAEKIGLKRTTLNSKMKKYGIKRQTSE